MAFITGLITFHFLQEERIKDLQEIMSQHTQILDLQTTALKKMMVIVRVNRNLDNARHGFVVKKQKKRKR